MFALSLHYMRLLSIFIILGVFMQLFSKQVIFVEYMVNKSYIAAVLCENITVPEKHCEGKCQLKKELDKDSKRQESSNSQKSKTISEIIFALGTTETLKLNTSFIREIFYHHNSLISYGHLGAVFHPPSI